MAECRRGCPSAHLGCLEPGCTWTFGEGVRGGHPPPHGGSCNSAGPFGELVQAAFVKGPCEAGAPCIRVADWGVGPPRIPESWLSALHSWRSLVFHQGLAQATPGYKRLLVIRGGQHLGSCRSMPLFLPYELGRSQATPCPGRLGKDTAY